MKKMISWVEIPTTDFSRAVEFYNQVFQLALKSEDHGSEKMACFPGGEGAIIYSKGYLPSDKGVLVSFTVPDTIDNTLVRIQKKGGKIVQQKAEIGHGKGFFAVVLDSEGNQIGLHQKG